MPTLGNFMIDPAGCRNEREEASHLYVAIGLES